MRTNYFLILISLVMLCACRDEVSVGKKTENLIPKDTMVMVLKDLTLIESHIQIKYIQVSTYKETMKRSGQVIMDKYHISKERFESSLDYYGTRQIEMQELYARVLDSLNLMSGQIKPDKNQPKSSVTQDSVPHLPAFIKMRNKKQ